MTGKPKIGDSDENNDFSSRLVTTRRIDTIDGNSKEQSWVVCIQVKLWELEEEHKGTNSVMEDQPVWKNICQ